jgi:nucleotide-binding universal stress UspA family protein
MAESRLRLLVPLDGSPDAETILPALLPVFRTRKVRLTLFGVIPPNDSPASLETYFARLRPSLLLDGVAAESEIARGDPAEEILWLAGSPRFDLIAMATHGRVGLRRAFLGSVTEKILRHSKTPVLAARPGTRIGDWHRIVVALDGSPAAEAILPDARALARATQATIHLARVKAPPPPATYPPLPEFHREEDPLPYLQRTADRLSEQGFLAVPEPREGDAAAEIVGCARKTDAGLVCLTTHGRTGLSRLFLGSVAEAVLRTSPCPVLLRRTVEAPIPLPAEAKAP